MTLQGRIQHFLGALQPAPGRRPAFLSVYIHDTDFDVQSELRSRNFAGADRAVLTSLASMLHQSFMSLHELARETRLLTRTRSSFMLTSDLRMSTCVFTMGRLALKLLR